MNHHKLFVLRLCIGVALLVQGLLFQTDMLVKQQLQAAETEREQLRFRVLDQMGLIKVQEATINECMGLSYDARDRDGGL